MRRASQAPNSHARLVGIANKSIATFGSITPPVSTKSTLRGANPGESPVYPESKFALLLNLKTAKALGLTMPTALLVRANEVIE